MLFIFLNFSILRTNISKIIMIFNITLKILLIFIITIVYYITRYSSLKRCTIKNRIKCDRYFLILIVILYLKLSIL